MSYLTAAPDLLQAAASNLAGLGSTIESANSSAAASTTSLLAAAEDEVSTAIAAMFGTHGQAYQAASPQAAAFHNHFLQSLTAGAPSYAAAETANAGPLQPLIDLINVPTETLFGRPLIGDGLNGVDGT